MLELIPIYSYRPNINCAQLINSLLGSADAEAFRDPVDWRGLGLDDYPIIIKRPMDLGTVKLRLERGAYATPEACAADVRLIWENCRTYNTGGVPRNLHKASKHCYLLVASSSKGVASFDEKNQRLRLLSRWR